MNGIRLLGRGWGEALEELIEGVHNSIMIVSPWITESRIIDLVLSKCKREIHDFSVRIYTTFREKDFADGISDLNVLNRLVNSPGYDKCLSVFRCSDKLHGKVYILDAAKMIITSGNLTDAGLTRNIEFGILLDDSKTVRKFGVRIEKMLLQESVPADGQWLASFGELVKEHQQNPITDQINSLDRARAKQLKKSRDRVFGRSVDDEARSRWQRIDMSIDWSEPAPGSILEKILDQKNERDRALALHGFLISRRVAEKHEEIKFDIAGALDNLSQSKQYLRILGFRNQTDYIERNKSKFPRGLKEGFKLARNYRFIIDGERLFSKNAFRSIGWAKIDVLRRMKKKKQYKDRFDLKKWIKIASNENVRPVDLERQIKTEMEKLVKEPAE